MATTSFYRPRTITQVDVINDITNIPSIPWTHTANAISRDNYAVSVRPLTTISGFWQEKFYRETSQLWLTNLNILESDLTLAGIEVELNSQRKSRVQDLVIQLTLDGVLIGENRASLVNPVQSDMNTAEFTTPVDPVQDYHVYGSATDMWGTELTSTDVLNESFGVVISFKSNQVVPHSDMAYVDQVGIRLTYV